MYSVPRCLFVDSTTGESRELGYSALPPKTPGSKRLVAISDTHAKHRLLRLPAGDILVHCGDLLSRGAYIGQNKGKLHHGGLAALRDINDWLGHLPYDAKVVIAGNHDASLAALAPDAQRLILSNAVYLQDSVGDVGGLRFYGTPWSSVGTSCNRAFQSAAPAIPTGRVGHVDVVMSHCHHDALAVALQPTLHVSGHAHNHHGVIRADEVFKGVAVNASTCDGVYRPTNLPVVVDVTPRVQSHQ